MCSGAYHLLPKLLGFFPPPSASGDCWRASVFTTDAGTRVCGVHSVAHPDADSGKFLAAPIRRSDAAKKTVDEITDFW